MTGQPYASFQDTLRGNDQETAIIWLCYILYCLALPLGGLPAIIALAISYVKRKDARAGRNSFLLLQHMEWQIATFWLGTVLLLVAGLGSLLLALSVVGMFLIQPLWLLPPVWYLYRLIRGMLALKDSRPVA